MGHAHHGHVMDASDCLKPNTWSFLCRTLGSWELCSCKQACFGIRLLFYNNIVSQSYCQYLVESRDFAVCGMCYLINIFFLLGDHVLKEAEP